MAEIRVQVVSQAGLFRYPPFLLFDDIVVFDTEDKDVRVIGDLWHPLVVTAGALLNTQTSGISKIAKSVIIPLADFGVSVYCLSTYKTDYVLVGVLAS